GRSPVLRGSSKSRKQIDLIGRFRWYSGVRARQGLIGLVGAAQSRKGIETFRPAQFGPARAI
ncbi:MAG: hypothetical protein EBZ36_13415, partial [Acidobacteria bacterium]|nr:hypothetical protein [Acidobacteriota bacterium]